MTESTGNVTCQAAVCTKIFKLDRSVVRATHDKRGYAAVTATVCAARGGSLGLPKGGAGGLLHTTLRTTLATLGEVRVCMWAGREVVVQALVPKWRHQPPT